MSLKAHTWAISQKLPPSRKLVLLMLAHHADDEGCCFPGIATLCAETGHYRETVTDAIKKLEDDGLIEVTRIKGRGSRYQLNMGLSTDQTVKADHAAKADHTTRQKPRTTTRQKPPLTYQENLPSNLPGESTAVTAAPTPAIDPPAPTPKPRKRSLPADFAISDAVRRWAEAKGFTDLDAHFEHFCGKAEANGYQYANWDAALRNAIRDDWAGLRRPNSHRNHSGGRRHEAYQRPLSAVERCRESAEEWARKRQEGNIIDLHEYRVERPGDSHAMDADGGDLWPQVGIGAR